MNVVLIPNNNVLKKVREVKGRWGSKLNPIQDINNNWVISLEEINQPEFKELWDTTLAAFKSSITIIPYNPKPVIPIK